MNLVNLTFRLSNRDVHVPASGTIARVESESMLVEHVEGIPVYEVQYGDVTGLPEPVNDTIYIVSFFTLQALEAKGILRTDVYATNTNPSSVIRDDDDKIVAITSLQR